MGEDGWVDEWVDGWRKGSRNKLISLILSHLYLCLKQQNEPQDSN